jgi:bifunctional non-homologous end joining protein LigD
MSKAVRRKDRSGMTRRCSSRTRGLIALVQAGVLEVHPWGSRIGNVEKPDRITFRPRSGEDVPWSALIEGAIAVRDRLRALDLQSFVKTTGGKGLHVVMPLTPKPAGTR